MKGMCNHKKVTFQSYSDSDSDSSDELAEGGLMHEVPVATAEENEQPPIPLASGDGVINADVESVADTHVDEQGAEPVEPGAVAEEAPESPRRSQRTRHQPDRFVPGTAVPVMGVSKSPAVAPDSTEVINTAYMSGYALAVTGQTVPQNYAEIANFGDLQQLWYESYRKEIDSNYEMGVVSELAANDVPHGARVLTSKLDFRNKLGPNAFPHGEIVDRKTRLCAHGLKKVEVMNFTETTAPTAHAAAN
jgi:hypothetical protein